MYRVSAIVRSRVVARVAVVAVLAGTPAAAVQAGAQEHQHSPPPPSEGGQQDHQQDHTQHESHAAAMPSLFPAREASGTAWLPDASPMYARHGAAGAWQLMWHGNLFLQLLSESGRGGFDQAGSINWVMGMARRELGGGRFGGRGMLSFEPWTVDGCGYPNLLASGERCEGAAIHDRQHPHDLLMEIALEYDHPLRSSWRWQVYGGLAGEPALGPAGYPHRLSALPNPLAPISHHWLDATHITFGLVTAGVYNNRWKAEMSAFNGREPDEERSDLDLGALDSVSGRVSFLPAPSLALQVSAGYLRDAEEDHAGGGRISVTRLTASATYHRALGDQRLWATTLAWGLNDEEAERSQALLVETSLSVGDRDTWFGRAEIGGKPAHALDVHGSDEVFTVGKLQAGYTRYFAPRSGLQPGIGGTISAGIVPQTLSGVYGGRVNRGLGVFVTLRPARHAM